MFHYHLPAPISFRCQFSSGNTASVNNDNSRRVGVLEINVTDSGYNHKDEVIVDLKMTSIELMLCSIDYPAGSFLAFDIP